MMADSYFWSPNIDLSDYYTGGMAPPSKLPPASYPSDVAADFPYGGYRPYEVPSAPALSSRSAPTVPINPSTGMPYATTVSARAVPGIAAWMDTSNSAQYVAPRVSQPNIVPGAIRDLGSPQYGAPGSGGGVLTKAGLPPNATTDKRYTQPLTPKPPGFAGVTGSSGIMRSGSGSLTAKLPSLPSAPVHQLNIDPPAVEGQMYADSMGLPVRSKSGKVYTPKVAGSAVMPSGAVAPRFGGARAPAASPQRSGGLFGMLFGGGSGGGLFGGNRGASVAAGMVPGLGALQGGGGLGPATHTPAGNVHPGAVTDNFGNDMAFMPRAYAADPANSNGGYRR